MSHIVSRGSGILLLPGSPPAHGVTPDGSSRSGIGHKLSRGAFSKLLRGSVPGVLGAVFLAAFPASSLAEQEAMVSISSTVRKLFEECRGAVVQVEAIDSQGVLKGTGFYVDPMGTIYTLASLAEGAEEVNVIRNGKKSKAEVLTSDPRSGIAILRGEPASCFLRPSSSKDLRIASPVLLIGYPLDLDLSPGFGLVAGFDRRMGGTFFPTTHLRVNIPVLRGQGGSPLLNMNGEVEGIVTSSVDGGSTCYVLPIQAVEKIRRDFARFGGPRHGWIGVRVDNEVAQREGSRAVVQEIDPDAPAGKAGIQLGDVVLRVGEVDVRSREDVLDASFFLTSGDETTVRVLRGEEILEMHVEAADHPSARRPAMQAGMDLQPPIAPSP